MSARQSLETWNERYFDGQLPEAILGMLSAAPIERADVAAFFERYFRLMQRGHFTARDLSPLQAGVLGTLVAPILPGAWSGRIPPVTMAGRHARLDEFVRDNRYGPVGPGLILDIGCGYPATTSLDTVAALPDWQVVAADPAMPAWVVYDEDGSYATIDEERNILYMQPALPNMQGWSDILGHREGAEDRFRKLFDQLLPALDSQAEIEIDGTRLVCPHRLYKTEQISLIQQGIGEIDIDNVDVIRCYNVLVYYDADFRRQALDWFEEILTEGGLLLIGADWAHTIECRGSVYQKLGGKLVHQELAFTVDNLCAFSILPWYALVDDDYETLQLAEVTRILRGDEAFLQRLDAFGNDQRARHGLGQRGADGYYGSPDASLDPSQLWHAAQLMSRALDAELADAAVAVLQDTGLQAWVNDIGHVAIKPNGKLR
jgi:hypothetical protein